MTSPPASAADPRVSIVIPVYNEREDVQRLHQGIADAMGDERFEVLYVDDGSNDGTSGILDEIAREDPRARVVHFVRNYGQTAALTAGFRNARAPILVTMDADYQNDPADIPMLLGHLEHHDVVCGWRKDRKDTWLTRKLPSQAANWLISALSKVPLHDYGCTLRAYRREFVEDIPLYGEMHRFIPIYVTWAGARLTEVPVRHHPRIHGETKYGLSRIFKVLLDLTTVKFLRDFFVTPIYFFGWVGFLLVFAGLATGLAAILGWALFDSIELQLIAACLTVTAPMLAIFGVLEITLGIIAEVLIRMHFELQAKVPYKIRSMRNMDPPARDTS